MRSNASQLAGRLRLIAPRLVLGLSLALAPGCSSSSGDEDTIDDTSDAVDAMDTSDASGGGLMVVNEVFATGNDDWVELYNAGTDAVDLGGWVLRDDDPAHVYTFPSGTIVPAGVFYLLSRDPDIGFDFGLGGADSVLLYDGDTLVDGITWVDGELPDDFSYRRFPDGTGPFATLFTPTPGTANEENPTVTCGDGDRVGLEVCDGTDFAGATCETWGFGGGDLTCVDCESISTESCTPRAAGLVINEVTSAGDDRIELFNDTGAAIDLTGWSLVDGGDNRWIFAPATTVEDGDYLVLTKGVDHDFGLGGDDLVELRDDQDQTVDYADWPEDAADPSWCRVPNGTGGFVTCTTPTFGSANAE